MLVPLRSTEDKQRSIPTTYSCQNQMKRRFDLFKFKKPVKEEARNVFNFK